MYSENRVIYNGGDAQDPDPALLPLLEAPERQVGEDAAAYPAEEYVVAVRVLGVEGSEQHYASYELRNPDSSHQRSRLSASDMAPIRLPKVMIVSNTSSTRGPTCP